MLESLEHRRLLSAVLEDGVLNVGGTNGDDYIALRTDFIDEGERISITINDERFGFAREHVTRVVINANAGDDRIVLGKDPASNLTEVVHYDIPTLVLGGRGQDTIFGGGANDTLDGGTGVNEVDGRGGDDLLRAGNTDTDIFRGGPGTDTVDYTGRTEDLRITLDDRADDGRPYRPTPSGVIIGPGDVIDLSVLAPEIPGEFDNVHADIENVIGGLGDDEITGNAANNILSGGGGDDMIFGGYGRDILNGNWGNDRLVGGRGADVIVGGGWNDTVDYSDHTGPVDVTLDGIANDGAFEHLIVGFTPGRTSIENDNVKGDVENVIGTIFDDRIIGNDASNTLDGRGGNDTLDGGGGNDLLRGGDGNDHFLADDGDVDTIRGGAGNDLAQADDDDLLIGTDRGLVVILV